MILSLFVILFALVGCGNNTNNPPNQAIDPVFMAEYNKFVGDAATQGVTIDQGRIDNLVITFATLEQPGINGGYVIGECTQGSIGPNNSLEYQVQIDTAYWYEVDSYTQESLLYHELGHCLLDRKHRLDIQSNGEPDSIMYPYIVESNIFDASTAIYAGYIVELFTHLGDLGNVGSQGCITERKIR